MSIFINFFSPSEIRVTGDSRLQEWRESLKLPVPGHEYTPRFKEKKWDGFHRPGKWCQRKGVGWEFQCSRGLILRLQKDLGAIDRNGRNSPHLHPSEVKAITDTPEPLRDYQKDSLVKILLQRWGRIALATNAGKGAIIGILSRLFFEQERPTLILCDEIAVFQALVVEIDLWGRGVPLDLIESGSKLIPEGPITLAMVPTLARRLSGERAREWRGWLKTVSAVFMDEADKASAKTWRTILRWAFNSEYRVGFSGTFPDDPYGNLIMDELMGPVLVREKNIALVERGISARPEVTLYPFSSEYRLDLNSLPWREWKGMTGPERRSWIYEVGVISNSERHDFIQSLIKPNTPTCIIVTRIEHGRNLADVIPDSIFLSGSASKKERERVLSSFEEGTLLILIVTKILDRGTNRLGHAVDVIFASGEGSDRQSLQRIGRGLRRTGGKEFLRILDVIDQGHRYLHLAAKKRIVLYHAEGFEVQIAKGE